MNRQWICVLVASLWLGVACSTDDDRDRDAGGDGGIEDGAVDGAGDDGDGGDDADGDGDGNGAIDGAFDGDAPIEEGAYLATCQTYDEACGSADDDADQVCRDTLTFRHAEAVDFEACLAADVALWTCMVATDCGSENGVQEDPCADEAQGVDVYCG